MEKEISSKNIRDACNEIKKLQSDIEIKTKQCSEQQNIITELNMHFERLKIDSSEASSQVNTLYNFIFFLIQ